MQISWIFFKRNIIDSVLQKHDKMKESNYDKLDSFVSASKGHILCLIRKAKKVLF